MHNSSAAMAQAQAQAADDGHADAGQYLSFQLGEGLFGIHIGVVREIIQHGPMTAMPRMPAFVRGVINLRGAVVPVIDLQARFGQGAAQLGKKSCVVIVQLQRGSERLELGLLVDAVSAVVDIAADAIEPPPSFGAPLRREFIAAVARLGQRFLLVLAPGRCLDIDEMASLCDQSMAPQAA